MAIESRIREDRRRLDELFRPRAKPVNRIKEVLAAACERTLNHSPAIQHDQHVRDWRRLRHTIPLEVFIKSKDPMYRYVLKRANDVGVNLDHVLKLSLRNEACQFRHRMYVELQQIFGDDVASSSKLSDIFGMSKASVRQGIIHHLRTVGDDE